MSSNETWQLSDDVSGTPYMPAKVLSPARLHSHAHTSLVKLVNLAHSCKSSLRKLRVARGRSDNVCLSVITAPPEVAAESPSCRQPKKSRLHLSGALHQINPKARSHIKLSLLMEEVFANNAAVKMHR